MSQKLNHKILAVMLLAVILWAATAVLNAGSGHAEDVPTPKDKTGHIAMGVMSYGACWLVGNVPSSWGWPATTPEQCLNVAMGVALAKEVYDHTQPKKHSAEVMDAAATAFGGLLMFTIERRFD